MNLLSPLQSFCFQIAPLSSWETCSEVTCAPEKWRKKGIRPLKNVFTVWWNITNLVRCHLQWESKHILIRLFKVEGPRPRLCFRVGQLIALFDVMFGICLHFDVTAWKFALCSTALLPASHTLLNETPHKRPRDVGTLLFLKVSSSTQTWQQRKDQHSWTHLNPVKAPSTVS